MAPNITGFNDFIIEIGKDAHPKISNIDTTNIKPGIIIEQLDVITDCHYRIVFNKMIS